MNDRILITLNGKAVPATQGTLLSTVIHTDAPCGGHGRCGKCRVIARGCLSEPSVAERDLLSEQELAGGIRLACKTRALGNCEIVAETAGQKPRIVGAEGLTDPELHPTFEGYGIAIDLGTTTIAAQLYDAAGNLLGQASRLNPQSRWGADVISRVEAALGGQARKLAMSVREAVDDIIARLAAETPIDPMAIGGLVITGNTVMLSLLTEQSAVPFSRAPFEVERLFGEELTAGDLELASLGADVPVYLPPCISAFVGADTVCAVLATRMCDDGTAMLADLGTNGEMALWKDGRLTVCSAAAGPAFEGVGISMGMSAADGAIDKVLIINGHMEAHVMGGGAPVGICGSGLIDAVTCLLDLEILDESGNLDGSEAAILSPVRLTQKDIRMLQLAKSAICAGLTTLAESRGLSLAEVARLYIAGGMGNYLSPISAARIGLLPKILAGRSVAVGNAALTGAALLLLDSTLRPRASALAADAVTLELSTSDLFADRYLSGMTLGPV